MNCRSYFFSYVYFARRVSSKALRQKTKKRDLIIESSINE